MTSRRTTPADPSTRPESAEAQRASAIVASLRAGEPTSSEMFEAFWQLDSLPVEEVQEALASWVGPLPDLDRLDPARRLALGLPLRPLRLRTLSVAKDADILDLGPVAEEQLRIAGKTWDGADVPAEDRLDGELEGSLAGTLERRVLADAEAAGDVPVFDVLLYGEDAGVVFAAGTPKVIALIADKRVELRDKRTRTALQEVLEAPVVIAKPSPIAAIVEVEVPPTSGVVAVAAQTPEADTATEAQAAPIRVAAKRTGAKKAPARKAAATKAPAAKAASKKAPAKKAPARKAAAKKTVARKTVAKTAPAAKVASKKTAAKKAPARKTAAKKKAKRK